MCKTVKERLVAFIEFKGLSKNKFEQICGLSRRYVSNISKSIQPDKSEKISLAFPELDTGWLLTGSGEMLVPAAGGNTQVIGSNHGTAINVGDQNIQDAEFRAYVFRKDAQVDELLSQNGKLIDIIKELTQKSK